MVPEPQYPPLLAELLPAWDLSAGAGAQITRAAQGTNNQTFLVAQDGRRFVLRISENLTVAQVRAEQRLLGWLRQATLPFEVPEPLATTGGMTVISTPAGPGRWRRGQARLADVVDRIQRLETTLGWLAASGGELVALASAPAAGPRRRTGGMPA